MATHTYQLVISYNVGGQFAANVLHFNFDDGGFGSTALAAKGLADGFIASKLTALKNILSSHVSILSFKGRALQVSGGFEGGTPLAAGNVGNRAGNLSAAGVGPCTILYPTGNVKQRGRIFWPGVSDSDCFDGILTAAFKTVMVTNVATIITPFAVVGGGAPTAQMVVWSRRLLTAFNVGLASTSLMIAQVRRRQQPA
jgi:hypothetical protein